MKFKKSELFSIPNCLCYMRLLLLPIFIYVYIKANSNYDYFIASGIILLSGLTDFADGFIARKFNMITELGKALDPFADKCTQVAIAFCLMFRFPLAIPLFIILVLKDGFLGISSLLMYRHGRKLDGAQWYGKVATAVFYVSMVILIVWVKIPQEVANILIGVSIFFMLIAFVFYIKLYREMFQQVKSEEQR
ncbi:MAG: CDP-alcohol phosphatidyltransferase family protein [Erysipelotrichaceae bacterium]